MKISPVATGAILSIAVFAAGCQSSDVPGALDVNSGNTAEKQIETITTDELRAYCPQVTLRSGTAYFNTYERGGDDDRQRIIYQASITDVTRSCTYAPGTLTMNVAVAGRVVPGPKGSAGEIAMPIRIVVVQGSDVLYSQLHKHTVNVGAAGTQFVFTDPAVTIPLPQERNIIVYAGYDEGPYNTP